ATAHGLEPVKSFAGAQQQASAQEACEALAEGLRAPPLSYVRGTRSRPSLTYGDPSRTDGDP
ncbi:hypothetical protein ABZS96_30285, partial [Streptomyces avermitilis]|uniref:hypothetical protein n=1 Tax=Streptomyces avermitilis TaxID=33903 RepID=UPI0033AD5F8D